MTCIFIVAHTTFSVLKINATELNVNLWNSSTNQYVTKVKFT